MMREISDQAKAGEASRRSMVELLKASALGTTCLAALCLAGMIFTAGCVKGESSGADSFWEARPSAMFREDLQVLAPHFAEANGCAAIRYRGLEHTFKLIVEVFDGGTSSNVSEVTLGKTRLLEGQVAFTVHDAQPMSPGQVYRMVVTYPGGSANLLLPKITNAGRTGANLELPKMTRVAAEEKVALCGYARGGDSVATKGPIEERAREANWAVVVSLKMD